MKRYITYIENYKNVKIYQYNDNKKYTASPYTYTTCADIPHIYSIEDNDLKNIKAKIDELINNYRRYFLDNLDY